MFKSEQRSPRSQENRTYTGKHQPGRMIWAFTRVHLTESLNAILNDILIRCMQEKKGNNHD